jgi:hypothetical protein
MLRSSFAALKTACTSSACWLPLGFTNGILYFANSNIEYLLGKLGGITRTFGHETSIADSGLTF